MAFAQLNYFNRQPIAFFAGAEGNVPGLKACLNQAKQKSAQLRIFLGNAFGAFGHSDETLFQLQTQCTWLIKGQHERQLLQRLNPHLSSYDTSTISKAFTDHLSFSQRDSSCPQSSFSLHSPSEQDTRLNRAQQSFSYPNIQHLSYWSDLIRIKTPTGAILACHDSPDYPYGSTINIRRLDKAQIIRWLKEFQCQGIVFGSDHQPWIEPLPEGRFIASCGASGFASHPLYSDVHYLLILFHQGRMLPRIEHAAYDAKHWAEQLHTEGVSSLLTYPLLKGLPRA